MMRRHNGLISCLLMVMLASPAFAHRWCTGASIGAEPDHSKGTIDEFEGIAKEDFPPWDLCHLRAIVALEYTLTATRATGDRDVGYPLEPCGETLFVEDELKPTWPLWWCSHGQWRIGLGAGANAYGTSVTWIAPMDETLDVCIRLYEDDKPLPIPGSDPDPHPDSTRDDIGVPGYGQTQAQIVVDVLKPQVAFFASVSGGVTTGPGGPDSNGVLHIWNGVPPDLYTDPRPEEEKPDDPWFEFCQNVSQGDTNNGTANYTGTHPHAAGSVIKVEMYAHITNAVEFRANMGGLYLPDESRQWLYKPSHWLIMQDKKGYSIARSKSQQWEPPDLEDCTWGADCVYLSKDWDSKFVPQSDYLYMADTPGLVDHTVGENGMFSEKKSRYRNEVQFQTETKDGEGKYIWLTLRPFPANGEPDWGLERVRLEHNGEDWQIVDEANGWPPPDP